ncbi:MAG: cobaltochelatase subunit CobN [Pseudomonadota bacterium]|nr:cobaltochelatase subunit CobN [Pseudomonadota bacterium]
MHLLQAQPGAIDDGAEAVDLGQTPGDVVVLSAADTEIAALAMARRSLGAAAPDLRLAQLSHLKHPMSVDLYVAKVITGARLVVGRFLGGTGYWGYAIDEIAHACRDKDIPFAALPGDDRADADLDAVSSVSVETCRRLLAYLSEGGPANSARFLRACTAILDGKGFDEPAEPLPRAGLYWPGTDSPDLDAILGPDRARPTAFIVFYRALVQGGATAPVDALVDALANEGVAAVPVFVSSLKDATSQATIETLMADAPPDIVLNLTAFAVGQPGEADGTAAPVRTVLESGDTPVLQVVMAASSVETWQDSAQGLGPRDIAMHVALPEVDGRVLTRAISFKAGATIDPAVQCAIVRPEPLPDRVAFVARLAANWIRLRRTTPAGRRVALVLANYPNRDGRLANGVGLDTPASAIAVLCALEAAGYEVEDAPADAQALMDRILAGPTNWLTDRVQRTGGEVLSLEAYSRFLAELPEAVRSAVADRWGPPEADPFFDPARGGFVLAILRFGHVVLGVQPARGYQIDPKASYHSPDLVPPHGYLAFHAWLRQDFGAQAIIHLGKHGNLEWLPGKALALSEACFPEAALGPLPNLYPFIVNDPGEGSQAKRRTSAVIVDHLTPPMTRAETYGALKQLEGLVDEYYDAAGLDRRRLEHLKREILSLVRSERLDADAGIDAGTDDDDAFQRLDNYLCDLKEAQIRDGLHVFGASPTGRQRRDLLVALARIPRRRGTEGDASLLRALAADLDLGFDPLDCEPAAPWTGARPDMLQAVDAQPWRTAGDTVERLELLAADLVEELPPHPVPPPHGGREMDGVISPPPLRGRVREGGDRLPRTVRVLEILSGTLAPALDASGAAEMTALLAGLDGRFVAPGPSGAPTRGRPDVLPTGRNFFSIDSRAMPTETAWALGWKSASRLIERHLQVNGDWPRAMALTAWGTSNMRTGGDDIAQAMALIGCRPTWEPASRRVTGFEILPPGVLGRPRVDLTLRISGFFRDAFPTQIDLFDSAVRAVMALDEPDDENPLAAAFRRDRDALVAGGMDAVMAARRAGFRIFGSKPGAYGAGLQALIDERLWDSTADFAEAFVAWGQYAYGGGTEGAAEADALRQRLARVEAVVQNQDNREHDLLDSDDYYQFEGGLAATVSHLSGAKPLVWHNDHSRPERPVIRSLEEEIGRVVRARAVNPKWIEGVMRHGYKGAFEMAATVDYLFAFAATTGAVKDHHFDLVEAAYLADDRVRDFITRHNPAALADIAARLDEAIRRGLWHPRANDVPHRLDAILKASGKDTP